MAPNKEGGSLKREEQSDHGGVISKAEVEARGTGTHDDTDTYDHTRVCACEIRVFFTGLMFLTRLPLPHWCDHHPAFLMRATMWFPLMGCFVGVWTALFLSAAHALWCPGVAVCVSTLASVWLTGCFHEDGLSDCFDGFGGGWGRKQILRIMKDSRIGTYALIGMLLVVGMKLRCVEHICVSQSVTHACVCVMVAHTVSRWTAIPLLCCCNYVQDDEDAKRGLYNWFAQSRQLLTPIRVLIGTATAVIVPYVLLEWKQALTVYITVVCVTVASGYYGSLVLGGVVGDYLGATIQVAELCVYLALTIDVERAQGEWHSIAAVGLIALLPILYSRRIVDYGSKQC